MTRYELDQLERIRQRAEKEKERERELMLSGKLEADGELLRKDHYGASILCSSIRSN